MFARYALIALLAASFLCHLTPQKALADESSRSVLENSWEDFKSPVSTPAKSVFLTGAALAITLAIFEDQISDPLQNRATNSRPLGNVATDLGHLAGSMIPNATYAGTMLIGSLISGNRQMRARGNLMFRASAYAQLTTTALKFIIREPRPDGSGEKVSFPSGHSTAAFSFASVIQAEHGWYYGAIAYTYATLVAYGRMNDNRHLLHDVVAGATVGMSFGLGLYHRQLDSKKQNQPQVTFLPAPDLSGGVLSASLNF